jgi:hypothetical protein
MEFCFLKVVIMAVGVGEDLHCKMFSILGSSSLNDSSASSYCHTCTTPLTFKQPLDLCTSLQKTKES